MDSVGFCMLISRRPGPIRWHHSRVHRFFSAARWDTDVLGTVVIRLIVGWLVPMGEPLVIAVDDTMFRRWGRKVHGAYWGYDGSVKAPPNTAKISRGNSFVVAAVVVQLPLLDRPVALPVLMRLWHKGGPSKTVLARRLIHALANAAPGRRLHVVADSAYACNQMRDLPQQATVTAPMPSHASLWRVHPDVDNPPRLRGPAPAPGSSAPASVSRRSWPPKRPAWPCPPPGTGAPPPSPCTNSGACDAACSAPDRSAPSWSPNRAGNLSR